MKVIERNVAREDVLRFYVGYDRAKKGQLQLLSLDGWDWSSVEALDRELQVNGLKSGVPAAYRTWALVEMSITDLLTCAIVNHIFPGQPQALGPLVLRGHVGEWSPVGNPAWWQPISSGTSSIPQEWSLLVRPAVRSETPAKWYVEDGSGRVLALLQRALGKGELARTAYAYVGTEPDQRSSFIRGRPELSGPRPEFGGPDA